MEALADAPGQDPLRPGAARGRRRRSRPAATPSSPGRLGVCIATAGPGAIHLLNGLYDAKLDGAPVLAITGQTYHDLMGMHYQQEVEPARALLRTWPSSTSRSRARRTRTPWSTPPAARRWRAGASRHINCCNDWQEQRRRTRRSSTDDVKGHTSEAWTPPIVVPQPESLKSAAALLNAGKKTVILAGQGRWGPATSSSRSPTCSRPRSSSRCWARRSCPTTRPYHHRRHRPARHAALREGDGGVRHPADGRDELPLHAATCPSPARPGPCRSTATRPGSACATRSTSA